MTGVKPCSCDRYIVLPGNELCSLCLSEQMKYKLSAERKKEKKAKDLEKALTRSKGSKVAVNPISKSKSKEQTELGKLKRELLAENPFCFTTGEYVTLETCDLSHIIPVGVKEYATDKRNLVLEKREAHHLWEHHKQTYSIMFPDKWRSKLLRVFEMDKTESKILFHKLAAKAE